MTIHGILIEETGGASGIHDLGAHGEPRDRPPVCGREQTDRLRTFLLMNGHYIDCDGIEAHRRFMRWFDTQSFTFAELAAWPSDNVKPLPPV